MVVEEDRAPLDPQFLLFSPGQLIGGRTSFFHFLTSCPSSIHPSPASSSSSKLSLVNSSSTVIPAPLNILSPLDISSAMIHNDISEDHFFGCRVGILQFRINSKLIHPCLSIQSMLIEDENISWKQPCFWASHCLSSPG